MRSLHPFSCCLAVAFCLVFFGSTARGDDATFKDLRVLGEVIARDGGLEVSSRSASIVLMPDAKQAKSFRVLTEVTLADKVGAFALIALPEDVTDLRKSAAAKVGVGRDRDGLRLNISPFLFTEGKWALDRSNLSGIEFWPNARYKRELEDLKKLGVAAKSWQGRKLQMTVDVTSTTIEFWIEGLLAHHASRPNGSSGPVVIEMSHGDRIHQVSIAANGADSLFMPVDLSRKVNDRTDTVAVKPAFRIGTVPFDMVTGESNALSLKQAGWNEVQRDPSSYYERYDAGPAYLHDPRMPFFRVPRADYAAVHVLAEADADPAYTNAFTVQAGAYGFSKQVLQYDFFAAIPRPGEKSKDARLIKTPAGQLFHVRVPLDVAFAQDLHGPLEFTLTKEIRLARRQPDPCRFRYRPLGLPSGVRIAAMTLEKSPLQMHVGSKESGHAFEEPRQPAFQVALTNITTSAQNYTLNFEARHLDGTTTKTSKVGRVDPGAKATLHVDVPVKKRGYHDLVVSLSLPGKRNLLQRHTSFALLPADTRKFRAHSPFGTWDFCGGHFTCSDPDITGPLYVKLGVRYGMFGYTPDQRKPYVILPGNEPQVVSPKGLETYKKHMEKHPDAPPVALLFHEHAISGRHVTRTPDFFHSLPSYKLDQAEKKRFDTMFKDAVEAAKAIRKAYPKAHIRLGNGATPTREEFYRHKFPAELFDSAGNECASFGRPPESQPPDWISNNASLWMDRQLLDAYGYKDKPVSQCYEICYPACNPGNLTLRTQADYLVRHALHALAWGVEEFRPGCISDMGNSYYYSNWGATGFCNRFPELNVKPSFVSFATMTRVLDGAKFQRVLDLGSPGLYGIEFDRPDGKRVFALWTLRGKTPLSLKLVGDWIVIDDQANTAPLRGGKVTLSPSPIYLVGAGKLVSAKAGASKHDEQPAGKATVLSSMANLDDWSIEKARNPDLEFYTFITPRRKGNFAYTPNASFEGKENVLAVKALPIKEGKDTMPMYSVLAHKKGIALPGTPTEIGMWVNGNSGWGRIIYELTDASDQRWLSIGSRSTGTTEWLADWLPKNQFDKWKNPSQCDWNTEDVFGISRINFDGWRYSAFPLPGNYPGEKYPWPANSQWQWDKDGVVHYPLTLRKVIVQLPEKVLHVRTFAPPPRPEIYLRDLTAAQGDTIRLKQVAWEERD